MKDFKTLEELEKAVSESMPDEYPSEMAKFLAKEMIEKRKARIIGNKTSDSHEEFH
jgi:hypothetical protein